MGVRPEEVKIGENGADYGAWKAAPQVKRYMNIITVLAAGVLFLRMVLHQNTLALICGLAMLAVGGYYFYLNSVKKEYSFVGGMMEKNHVNLVKNLKWDGAGKAVDVGCGNGPLTVRVAKSFEEAEVTGVDNWGMFWGKSSEKCDSNAEKEGVKERVHFDQSDIVQLPYKDGQFDAMVSSFAYSEIKRKSDKKPIIKESLRILKKGGAFSIQDFFGRTSMFGTPDELMRWMKRQGVSEVHYIEGENEIGIFWGRK